MKAPERSNISVKLNRGYRRKVPFVIAIIDLATAQNFLEHKGFLQFWSEFGQNRYLLFEILKIDNKFEISIINSRIVRLKCLSSLNIRLIIIINYKKN